jgi:hypothetical protein
MHIAMYLVFLFSLNMPQAEILKELKIDLYTFQYKSNGILYVYISGERDEEVEDTIRAVKASDDFMNFKKRPVLYSHQEFALPSKEVREYFANHDANPNSLADAFLTNTLAMRLIANAYLTINKPSRPTRFFQDENEAEEWLLTFVEQV